MIVNVLRILHGVCNFMTSTVYDNYVPACEQLCLCVFLQIYDIQSGQKLLTLNNPDLANNYKRNCATFNPTDDLVLNDGVMWDVRTSQAIHKFDKFNMNISGVFHPNGLEVIINTEIVSFSAQRTTGGGLFFSFFCCC